MKKDIHIKYLIGNEKDALWGLTINSVGYQRIEKNSTYPPANHPTHYLFSIEKGRVLNEYQLIYITKGEGNFMSSGTELKNIQISEGHMFLLFPNEWHNYKPNNKTGWDEYWIGFSGVSIDNRIQNAFFNKKEPIFNVGIREDIVSLYNKAITIAKEQKVGYQQMLAGIVNYLLGLAYSQNKHSQFENSRVTNQINKAKIIMLEKYLTDLKPEEVAKQVNMSYSWFRQMFKQYTGFSPSQYILELKIQKSKELLTCTRLNSQEIAFQVGFNNSDYYCTVFKKIVGLTPIAYRKASQGAIFEE